MHIFSCIWLWFKLFKYYTNITKLTKYIPYPILHCKHMFYYTANLFKYVRLRNLKFCKKDFHTEISDVSF